MPAGFTLGKGILPANNSRDRGTLQGTAGADQAMEGSETAT